MKYEVKVEKPNKDGYIMFAETFEGLKLLIKFILTDDLEDKNSLIIRRMINDKTFIQLEIDWWDFDKYENNLIYIK